MARQSEEELFQFNEDRPYLSTEPQFGVRIAPAGE